MPWNRLFTLGPTKKTSFTTATTEFSQYLSIRYTERLAEAGVEPSVGTVGDSYDNAMAEVIWPNGP
jgi:transposase InsO family protein